MANNKKFIAKNGLGAQNIEFTSPDGTKVMTLQMLNTDVLSADGDIVATDFVRPSDERLKSDVTVLGVGKPLNPVRFTWIDSGEGDIGFLAGQIVEAYPEAIKEFERDGVVYRAVAYDKLTAVLAAQLNYAMSQIDQLRKELDEIKKANG